MKTHLAAFSLFVAVTVSTPGCMDRQSSANADSTNLTSVKLNAYSSVVSLTSEELEILRKLKNENGVIIFGSQVKRFFSPDSVLLSSELEIPKDTLLNSGYVSYDFKFVGDIGEVKGTYEYSKGQADYGYGSFYGESVSEYYHNFTSYGLSAKIVSSYNNGSSLFSKVINLK